jgi:hypothetical protein
MARVNFRPAMTDTSCSVLTHNGNVEMAFRTDGANAVLSNCQSNIVSFELFRRKALR